MLQQCLGASSIGRKLNMTERKWRSRSPACQTADLPAAQILHRLGIHGRLSGNICHSPEEQSSCKYGSNHPLHKPVSLCFNLGLVQVNWDKWTKAHPSHWWRGSTGSLCRSEWHRARGSRTVSPSVEPSRPSAPCDPGARNHQNPSWTRASGSPAPAEEWTHINKRTDVSPSVFSLISN